MNAQDMEFEIKADIAGYMEKWTEIQIAREMFTTPRSIWIATLKPHEPCDHPGCLHHVTHPCEGCGRIAGQWPEDSTGKWIAYTTAAVAAMKELGIAVP